MEFEAGVAEEALQLSDELYKHIFDLFECVRENRLPLNIIDSSGSEAGNKKIREAFVKAFAYSGEIDDPEITRLYRIGLYGLAIGGARADEPVLLFREAEEDETIHQNELPMFRELRLCLAATYSDHPKNKVEDPDGQVRYEINKMVGLAYVYPDLGLRPEHTQLGCLMMGAGAAVDPCLQQEFMRQAQSMFVDQT